MATINIFCPQCETELAFDDEFQGQQLQCPQCQSIFVAEETITVKCPNCGANRNIFTYQLGTEVKCHTCIKTFTAELSPAPENKQIFITESTENDTLATPPKITLNLNNLNSRTALQENSSLKNSPSAEETSAKTPVSNINTEREVVRKYFKAHYAANFVSGIFATIMEFILDILNFVPTINIIPIIIRGIVKAKLEKLSRSCEPIYDKVQKVDLEYLKALNVLERFGKKQSQLISETYTLFAPAFDGVNDLVKFQAVVSEADEIYRYNLEEVTKVYTFEDQLFIYTGIWTYGLGKMISETTEAFFFKDITDIRTESVFKIHTEYIQNGCLSVIIPWFRKKIQTVYKESENFVLTSNSGNCIGLTIGYEDAIAVTGANYTSRNDNEHIIQAVRKMIEEKKVANNG